MPSERLTACADEGNMYPACKSGVMAIDLLITGTGMHVLEVSSPVDSKFYWVTTELLPMYSSQQVAILKKVLFLEFSE